MDKDVESLMTVFMSELMTDPFNVDNTSEDTAPLINFATGVVMPADAAALLLKAYELGKLQMTIFVEQWYCGQYVHNSCS